MSQEIFQKAVAEYVDGPDDNPDNRWFYAAWSGMQAVTREHGIEFKTIEGIVHNAIGWTHGENYDAIVQAMKMHAPTEPPKPERFYGSYASMPAFNDEDVETNARRMFRDQFRTKYPEERINGKLAREKWAQVQDKARSLARQALERNLQEWQAREDEKSLDHSRKLEEWQRQCNHVRKIHEILRTLEGGETT